jgi:uncharacterized protein (TIGR00255 family)
MIHSMTAFARQSLQNEKGLLTWELRSVNHRYSEVSLRLPEEFRGLEPKVRELINAAINRGKVDANLRFQATELSSDQLTVNHSLVKALKQAAAEVESELSGAHALGIADVLRWPGVLIGEESDITELHPTILELLQTALRELLDTRKREGEKLRELLLQRCQALRQEVQKVSAVIPDIVPTLRQRVMDKIKELQVNADEGRLEQEIAMQANRADIHEEVDRLYAHIDEIERVLDQGKPVGRRLDFLMQELNREANTLGSKAISTVVSQSGVELKVLIEQMREQIQNIE